MGSNNGTEFFDIAELTKEADQLPAYAESAKQWTSETLHSSEAYRYLRFVVTASAGPGINQYAGQYFFAMSEFDLLLPKVVVYEAYVEVTEQQWMEAYKGVAAAQTVMNLARTEAQVAEALADLQRKYDVLLASKDASTAYQLEMSAYEFAGLYLKKNAIIPTGVTAYVVNRVNPESVTLTPITDGIVPANTGVIVKAKQGLYSFTYTDQSATATSLLKGSVTTRFIKGEPNMNYYLFGVRNGKVGLYKALLEYTVDGLQSNEINDTDKGGYFKVSAHKVYLSEGKETAAHALSFVFDDLTGIDDTIVDSEQSEVYDLQGRRIYEIQKSGLYIVNGQKRYINK